MRFRSGWNAEVSELEVRNDGFITQYHVYLTKSAITFSEITGFAGHDHIAPTGNAPARFGPHMIDRQGVLLFPAILAGIIISSKDILFAEGNAFATVAFHHSQYADNSRQSERC